MRGYFIPICLTIVVFITCGLISSYFDRTVWGWGGSLFIICSIGFLGRYDGSQWLITLGWYISLVLAHMAILPYGATLLAVATVLGLYLGALGVRDQFQGTQIQSFDYIIRVLLGQLNVTQIVQPPSEGSIEASEPMFGPRTVIVKPETAVIMEKGATQTKISGPNTFISEPFEYVKKIYNLRPLHRTYKFRRVHTRDLITTTVSITITYGVDVAIEARLGERPLTSTEIDAVRRLDSWASDWETELRSVVEMNVRRAVGVLTFSQATDTENYYGVLYPVIRRTEHIVYRWGLRLYSFGIVALQPDSSVSHVQEENWLVNTRTDTLKKQEKARSEAWKQAVFQLVEAYTMAKASKLPVEIFQRELLRRVFEQAALDPTTRDLLPEALGNILSDVPQDDDQVAEDS